MDVLVTGIGAISCLGADPAELWAGLCAANSKPQSVSALVGRAANPLAYQVPDEVVPPPVDGEPVGARVGRASRFALHAARQAVADAGLTDEDVRNMAVVIGTGMGECGMREGLRASGELDTGTWHPTFSVASAVGEHLGAYGPNISVSNACAASGYGLSIAMDMIEGGEVDTVLVGGAEGLSNVAVGSFDRLGAIDPDRCRPFDVDRRGTVFGEGAAMLVVRRADRAAGGYGRLAGSSWSCDAFHPTAPDPEHGQMSRVARQALRHAGMSPSDIGCVVPHGTGTRLNDVVESQVLGDLLGAHRDTTPLLSLKASLGHTAGAAAAFAVVTAVLMTRQDEVPPNMRLDRQDPDCDVWLPQDERVPLARPNVLVNAYAFGGNNFSMVFEGVAA